METPVKDLLLCLEIGCLKEATTELGYCDEHFLINVSDDDPELNEY